MGFKDVPGKFLESFKKFQGCFNGVLSGVQECLKEFQWMLEGSFKGVSRKFQGCFKED